MSIKRKLSRLGAAAAVLAVVPAVVAEAAGVELTSETSSPVLTARAVLPAETYAPGPPSGTFFGSVVTNGVQFPLPSQPIEGFSGIVSGRRAGEYLAMPDNGFGNKANSYDFLIRAYYIKPDFKTRNGGSGTVDVFERTYISFSDPDHMIEFPIVNGATSERLLTGADIDPESIQRGDRGEFWVGDEFGPWILHFDRTGRLLEPPIALPDGLMSPANPNLVPPAPATVAGSRGLEAMAISPNGRWLTLVLEVRFPATTRSRAGCTSSAPGRERSPAWRTTGWKSMSTWCPMRRCSTTADCS